MGLKKRQNGKGYKVFVFVENGYKFCFKILLDVILEKNLFT